MKTIKLCIIGFGNVGRGVTKVILEKESFFASRDLELRVVAISDLWGSLLNENGIDLERALKAPGDARKIDGRDVAMKADYDVLVEATTTNIDTGEPGYTHMKAALGRGKHVVTSNKGPLALHYSSLMELARERKCQLRFEASVGGAMPIINLARETLAGNDILWMRGVLNGTTNYILTRMAKDGLAYQDALSEAKEIGIAEANPSYDVEGIDAACKLVILANSIFGMDATYKDVEITGITGITPEALSLAEKSGYVVRLIAEVKKEGTLKVAPRLVPKTSALAVEGTLNAASILTDLAGEITVTGKGAGPIEAASSIISDLLCIFR